jgi:hypothetical protein
MEQTDKIDNLNEATKENEHYDSLNFISVRNVSLPDEEGDGEPSTI